jgi:hypothetical protein
MQLLNLVNTVQPSGVPEDADEGSVDTPESRALLREAAAVRSAFAFTSFIIDRLTNIALLACFDRLVSSS